MITGGFSGGDLAAAAAAAEARLLESQTSAAIDQAAAEAAAGVYFPGDPLTNAIAGLSGNKDPKTLLNMFCQRYCKKTITKQDIIYQCMKFGTQHQATVTLHCLDGVQFAGEVAPNAKEAEKSVANIALQNYAEEVCVLFNQVTKTGKNGKKRKATDAFTPSFTPSGVNAIGSELGAASVEGGAPPETENARMALNTLLMRWLKRSLGKSDMVFTTTQTNVGFQSMLALPCLEGEWSGLQWAGEVATKKKVAEENAAKQALNSLEADPAVQAALRERAALAGAMKSNPNVRRYGPGSKGGGKGGWGKSKKGMF